MCSDNFFKSYTNKSANIFIRIVKIYPNVIFSIGFAEECKINFILGLRISSKT